MSTPTSTPFAKPPQIPLANLRDLGGPPVRGGGWVRTGLLYRSTDLSGLDDEGLAALAGLGLRTVYDLRTRVERDTNPDRLPPGARYLAVDVLADGPAATSPSHLMDLIQDPRQAARILSGGGAVRIFEAKYREFVLLASARDGYGRLFRDLARTPSRPGLVHCTTGKDRTGWAVAALLLLLDVPEDAVMNEYLASSANLLQAFDPALEAFRARGGDPELLRPLLGVRPEFLRASLDAVRDTYGCVESYFADGLSVDAAAQRSLREAFIAPG